MATYYTLLEERMATDYTLVPIESGYDKAKLEAIIEQGSDDSDPAMVIETSENEAKREAIIFLANEELESRSTYSIYQNYKQGKIQTINGGGESEGFTSSLRQSGIPLPNLSLALEIAEMEDRTDDPFDFLTVVLDK